VSGTTGEAKTPVQWRQVASGTHSGSSRRVASPLPLSIASRSLPSALKSAADQIQRRDAQLRTIPRSETSRSPRPPREREPPRGRVPAPRSAAKPSGRGEPSPESPQHFSETPGGAESPRLKPQERADLRGATPTALGRSSLTSGTGGAPAGGRFRGPWDWSSRCVAARGSEAAAPLAPMEIRDVEPAGSGDWAEGAVKGLRRPLVSWTAVRLAQALRHKSNRVHASGTGASRSGSNRVFLLFYCFLYPLHQ
jgi:hypothetical protein